MSKLWAGKPIDNEAGMPDIHTFTVGNDKQFDVLLAPFDVLGTRAHVRMLHKINLLNKEELSSIEKVLEQCLEQMNGGTFVLEKDVEDVHSQIEIILTRELGDIGKKIHAGRSRNDQVLMAIKLYLKDEVQQIASKVNDLFLQLMSLSEAYKDVLLPGYTHMQVAMPSSFGLWFAAYAESLGEDMEWLNVAFNACNRNPLGSAAGYGSSFPIDRFHTAQEAGMSELNYNAVYAQMTRGKTERAVATAIGSVAATLNKLAADVCLFMMNEMKFVQFPDALVTGSSIMPHKKNPDVFELIRGKTNMLTGITNTLSLLTTNLPSGYHREMQLTKEILFPGIQSIKECLTITTEMLKHISVRKDILSSDIYKNIWSVEAVNELVLKGVSFREAYVQIKESIAADTFNYQGSLNHTHVGSSGNLYNSEIKEKFKTLYSKFLDK